MSTGTCSSAFYRKCQCYSVNRKRLKSLLFCTHSVISTANNGSVVFEASCVQVRVYVHNARYLYAIHMCTDKICCVCQKAYSHRAGNEYYSFCGWVWSLLCVHAVLCFVKTCMCVYRTNAILSKSELLNSMATKHSKKCQSCSSWSFSCGAIILVLVSSTLVLL